MNKGPITRRNLLGLAAATPLTVGASQLSATPSVPASEQNAGWYRFGLGEFEVTIVSDGHLDMPTTGLGVNADRKDVQSMLDRYALDLDRNYSHTNHAVIDTGEARVLVDVGSGDRFQPTVGRLLDNLEAAGIEADSITHVALTHAHPDHVWGMMDDFGDEPRIPDAAYTIGAAEFDWWMSEDRVTQVPESLQAMVVGAQNALSPMAEQMTMAVDGTEVVPGIRMLATPGHTPGHMAVMVESAGEALVVTGDVVSHLFISFQQPNWHGAFDTEKEQAAETRKRFLDMAATDRLTVSSYHLPFPGVGHVVTRGSGYDFVPATWLWSE